MSHDCNQCTLYSLPKRLQTGPAAGKFTPGPQDRLFVHRIFFLALIAGFTGSAYLGLHLWLMRSGSMAPWPNYIEMRSLHAAVQLYLFFGLFAVGFILQAAPTFLGVEPNCSKLAVAAPVLIVSGVALEVGIRLSGLPDSAHGKFPGIIISGAGFALVAFALAKVLGQSDRSRAVSFGLPMITGLTTIAVSTLLDPADPQTAVFALWGGIGSFVFAAAQKFIAGSLGGSTLKPKPALLFLILHMTTILLIGSAIAFPEQPPFFHLLLPAAAMAALAVYYFRTGLYRSIFDATHKPLAFALHTGFFWAAVGIAGLCWPGHLNDLVAHTWALGWFAPLIIVVSSQIVGHLSERELFRPQTLIRLLFLWQLVPLGRGFGHTLPGFQWIVSFVISAVFICWGFQMAARIFQMERSRIR